MSDDSERSETINIAATCESRVLQAEDNTDVLEDRRGHNPSVDFENITAADDALQVVVSTTNNSVRGRDIHTQTRAGHILGAMSDATLQRLSEDRTKVMLNAGADTTAAGSRQVVKSYGPGRTLGKGE